MNPPTINDLLESLNNLTKQTINVGEKIMTIDQNIGSTILMHSAYYIELLEVINSSVQEQEQHVEKMTTNEMDNIWQSIMQVKI